jgi:DmsE family decaheme c-type cytochrome
MNKMTLACVRAALALNLALGLFAALPAHAAEAPASDGPAAAALKKDAVCTGCHDENDNKAVLSIYQTRHGVKGDARTPSCQSCHGESAQHVAGGKPTTKGNASRPAPEVVFKASGSGTAVTDADTQAGTCATCHKGGKRVHWDGSQHQARGVACSGCHAVHVKSDPVLSKLTQPETCYACHKTERAQTHRVSTHPLAAGKMSCSDCHNPHGTTGPKLLAKNSVNETCATCHAEKRGPFLWEHGPVADDCTTCHTPHGSSNSPLLKARAPMLCQQCHSGDHGAQANSGANLAGGNVTTVNGINPLANAAARAQLAGRACLNCHVLVHGSNHPAGSKFQR